MDGVEKIILKRQLYLAPLKLILSIILGVVAFKQYGMMVAVLFALTTYGGLSTVFFFAKFWHNKIVGLFIGFIILGSIVIIIHFLNEKKQAPQWVLLTILCFITLAGILLDIYRIIKLIRINRREKGTLSRNIT